jgi:hypothetical protein
MPNKIGDYLAAGLPIIHSRTQGELARLIAQHQFGTTYSAGHTTALQAAIQTYIYPAARATLIQQSANARIFAQAHLDRRKIYAALAGRLEGKLVGP